jgi:cytochrome c oxidase subunit 4
MRSQARTLVLVWVALMVLLGLTAGSAWLHLGWWNTALNLGIAAAKAALVLLFFMRLRGSPPLARLAALAGVATLAVLFALSGADYATRKLAPAPMQAPRQLAPHA